MKKLNILVIPFVFLSAFNFQEMPAVTQRNNASASQNSIYSYSNAINEVKKSVVNISTQKKVTNNLGGIPYLMIHCLDNSLEICITICQKIE